MQCSLTGDTSDPSMVDIFALNSYSWCGDSSFSTSTYTDLVTDLQNTSVPVFFSEYGCIKPYPRIFTEVPTIYGPLMTPVLSGGLVYEYAQEDSGYGVVVINSNGSAQLLADYDTLQNQFNTLNITLLQGLTPQNTTVAPVKCSSSLITNPGFVNNFNLPDPPPGVQDLIDNGISKNPNNGKLISVTATKVTQVVQASNGQVMTGLAITLLADDESNNPSGSTTSTATSAAPAATTSTKKGGAASMRANWFGMTIALAIAAGWSLLV
jgi:hypothetical protein